MVSYKGKKKKGLQYDKWFIITKGKVKLKLRLNGNDENDNIIIEEEEKEFKNEKGLALSENKEGNGRDDVGTGVTEYGNSIKVREIGKWD